MNENLAAPQQMFLSQLKRLTAPFPTEEARTNAALYWDKQNAQDREWTNRALLREFYRLRGVDIDEPMDRTAVRLISSEKDRRESEEWHEALDRFILDQ